MKTVILCVGNIDGGDDGVGPYIASNIVSHDRIHVINGGVTPENFTGRVREINPNQVIIIDAVDMQLKAGEIRIIPEKMIGTMHVSTHSTPLSVLIKYLKTFIDNVFLIGIQPKTMSGHLTKEVKSSADYLLEILKKDVESVTINIRKL